MEIKFINMENLSKYFGHLKRKYPTPLQIQSIGFSTKKQAFVKRIFDTYNFSFILGGHGCYKLNGREHRITAPCVITQWPGELMDYGPDKTWFEVYFIYPAECGKYIRKRNFLSGAKPFWHMDSSEKVSRQMKQLHEYLQLPYPNPDKVDYVCEGLILESLQSQAAPPQSRNEEMVREISTYIKNNFTENINHEDIAAEYGMSLSTFRRHWLKYMGIPPAQYQSDLIIREACSLLVETGYPIQEIAAMLKFKDPLYFSKKFHKETGHSPKEYRTLNQPYPI